MVAEHRGVHAGERQRAHLGFTLEQVEHRRALEAVTRVEPQRAIRAGADSLRDRGDLRNSAIRRLLQTVRAIEDIGDEVVREQPRVDVRRMDERQADVLPDEIRLRLRHRARATERGSRDEGHHDGQTTMHRVGSYTSREFFHKA